MKKVTLFFAVVGLLSAASCKKDYTCTCSNGYKQSLGKAKKSDAESACSTLQLGQAIIDPGTTCGI